MRGSEDAAVPDAVIPPRANPELVGHEAAEAELYRLYRAGRLPHAILLAGPRGIGKATLAFRFARFLLAQSETPAAPGRGLLGKPGLLGEPGLPEEPAEPGLAVDPESGAFRRVAAGGHADLLTIERAWDPRRRRLRGAIIVEDAREIAGFFRLTAAEEGWRIVVIDGAEEMNRNAANAVLKILEEPPARGLLLLVSHNPGRLLPTIRSRCRRLALSALPAKRAADLLRQHRPQLSETEAAALARLVGGSVGRALELANAGGLDLYRALIGLLAQAPAMNLGQLYGLADRLARADAEDAYRAGEELLLQFLARLAVGAARDRWGDADLVEGEGAAMRRLAGHAGPALWTDLRQRLDDDFAAARELNLDRKQTMLSAFFAIDAMAR